MWQDIAGLPIFKDGWVQVQDEASQLIIHLLDPGPGERVLDLTAGLGGKTTHIGMFMGNEGEILAVDNTAWKLEELKDNARRQGVTVVKTLTSDAMDVTAATAGTFDRVLVDAPCSGFGSIRRNPDIKWRRHPKDPYRFFTLQKELLEHAALLVKEGGRLVYATCTIFRDEDENVVEYFADGHPDWEVVPAVDLLPESCRSMAEGEYFKSWPHRHGIDGFFGVHLRRKRE